MASWERLVEVYEITEYRDGAVYNTESRGYKWIRDGETPPKGFIYTPPSTKVTQQLHNEGKGTIRRVRD